MIKIIAGLIVIETSLRLIETTTSAIAGSAARRRLLRPAAGKAYNRAGFTKPPVATLVRIVAEQRAKHRRIRLGTSASPYLVLR
jgi:hypothetical protein